VEEAGGWQREHGGEMILPERQPSYNTPQACHKGRDRKKGGHSIMGETISTFGRLEREGDCKGHFRSRGGD